MVDTSRQTAALTAHRPKTPASPVLIKAPGPATVGGDPRLRSFTGDASQEELLVQRGFALEKARSGPTEGAKKLAGLRDRAKPAPSRPAGGRRGVEGGRGAEGWPTADQLVASGITALAGRLLDAWRPRGRVGTGGLLRGAVAGAAAALAVEVLRPLLEGRIEAPTLDKDVVDRLLVGAGQGLVYGGAIESRLPGPDLLKGAAYGSAEYAADPLGGLAHMLGSHAPQGRLPVVGRLLEDLDHHDRAYLEHVAFGMALALLYGSTLSSNGIRPDVGDEE